ncbi:MAG: hypothetical protein ACE5KV_02785, partial [Thermoplasmata archaeon]
KPVFDAGWKNPWKHSFLISMDWVKSWKAVNAVALCQSIVAADNLFTSTEVVVYAMSYSWFPREE